MSDVPGSAGGPEEQQRPAFVHSGDRSGGKPVARWWRPEADGRLLCYLCPRYCRIGEGQAGFCFIRMNTGGALRTLAYAQPCAIQVDPIEKKPLFHYMPGARIFSMGTAGCNMGCKFCQNWEISKSRENQVRSAHLPPGQVVREAGRLDCPALAFTYNEPTIWGEYVIDISRAARRAGLRNVMVTNGYITREALPEVYEFIDAANVDLKAFSESFYAKVTLTHLRPVLDRLPEIKRRGVWVELTNLLIPTLNDDMGEIRRLSSWVVENLGRDVPLHFTAFHPDFRLTDLPPTPHETLHEARSVALAAGLRYVYEGNVHCDEGSTTRCPSCGEPVIRRAWHRIMSNRISEGRCPCGHPIAGFFPVAC
ncbi:MAG TPA: AmmeMemoRadiSam system radical SAM enzyme [Candidatus Polarisedimenticolia bacterium]|nr:AmmeMemoRadiSam system radical SAM enzyme [Candidatus Polarisedimenticolia bacterium]